MKARLILNEISRDGKKTGLGSIGVGHSTLCRAYKYLETLTPGFDSLQLKKDPQLLYDLDICFTKITRELICNIEDIMVFPNLENQAADIQFLMNNFFNRNDIINYEGRIRLDSGKYLEYKLDISYHWQAATINILNINNKKKYTLIRYK